MSSQPEHANSAGAPPAAVAETHTAVVVFIGDRAYKVKKPVSLGFLDFSTVEARAEACRREVELNRRLAPDVYIGVAEVVDGRGAVCDHLVVMRRMPDDRRLSTCIRRGDDVTGALRRVAFDVAALHLRTPPDPVWAWVGSAERLWHNWHDSFEQIAPYVGAVIPEETASRVEQLVDRYLAGRTPLFDTRVADGWVRDGHGDLLADDIFLLPDGPRVLDCIEFSDELRWCDVLNDVAFLAMDLERLGRADLAAQFLAWHREFSADVWPPSLAHHYIAYRAHVRAKVGAIRVGQGDESAAIDARDLYDLTLRHLERGRVRLILVGGLPGTGKSTLADAISERLPVVVLRSDELRPGVAAGNATAFGEGRYAPDLVDRNYQDLVTKARRLLELGESVVLDASWSDAGMRALARDAAAATVSDLVELQCEAPPEVADARLVARRQRGTDPSEATPEIAAVMRRCFDEWPEVTAIDTTTTVDQSASRALHVISVDRAGPKFESARTTRSDQMRVLPGRLGA